MKALIYLSSLILIFSFLSCQNRKKSSLSQKQQPQFAKEMTDFTPYNENPTFSGTNTGTWDNKIRERGYILHDEGIYKMWYTGYKETQTDPKYLGYATSSDGINWKRYSDKPIFDSKWTEDVFVIKNDGKYYMLAEGGTEDIAHLLISEDGINWEEQGDLIMLETNGDTILPPYGTPTAWIEDGKWYLFYERNDEGIWLATSTDLITWKNIQDDPVISLGPDEYDAGAVAANQVIKFKENYYLFYHGSSNPDWSDPNAHALWSSNVAVSTDLTHWVKYPKNPIADGDTSSPIVVNDGKGYRLYTMHDKVCVYFPK